MRITESAPARRQRTLGWLLACSFVLMPIGAAAQVTFRPTPPPIVTAESERWYLEGQPITYSGSVYYQSGPAVYFNPYEMVRSGEFRGIPLYSLKTREPYAVVFVPLDGGQMQPFERRRAGEMAGTVGSSAPSFPVDRDHEATFPDTGLQAIGSPIAREFYPIYGYSPMDDRASYVSPAEGTGGSPAVEVPRGPLTTALKPAGLNAFYIEYQGRRWFSSGPAMLLDPARFSRSGEYHGFPVYVSLGAPADTIYVAVANAATGLLTPYSAKK